MSLINWQLGKILGKMVLAYTFLTKDEQALGKKEKRGVVVQIMPAHIGRQKQKNELYFAFVHCLKITQPRLGQDGAPWREVAGISSPSNSLWFDSPCSACSAFYCDSWAEGSYSWVVGSSACNPARSSPTKPRLSHSLRNCIQSKNCGPRNVPLENKFWACGERKRYHLMLL